MAAIACPITTNIPMPDVEYPTSDGKPMGETDLHRSVMVAAIETLKMHYAGQLVYVSGNILLFYRPGNKRRHVSPDVMVVQGLEQRDREHYLLWEEGRAPNIVIEITSESTRDEDMADKLEIYRDEIGIAEYFLFDPRSEYLSPALQGHRLSRSRYEPIVPVGGRLPSAELGLHLEADGSRLRFYDPTSERWLSTPQESRLESLAALEQKDAALEQKDAALQQQQTTLQEQQVALQQQQAALEQQQAALEQQQAALQQQQTTLEQQQAALEQQQTTLEQQQAALQQSEAARRQSSAEAEQLRHELDSLRRATK